MNLANNHSYDFGADGARQTTAALRKAKVEYAGLPDQVGVVSRRDQIAVVGFATYKWAPSLNDPAVVDKLVGRAKKAAEIVVVLFHGGAEGSDRTHVPTGSEFAFGENRGDLRRFGRAAIDAGADVVLGSGPHVIRDMEVYRKRLIAYSLGNFAGVGNFATGGTLSLSALLTMRLSPTAACATGLALADIGQLRHPASGPDASVALARAAALDRRFRRARRADIAERSCPAAALTMRTSVGRRRRSPEHGVDRISAPRRHSAGVEFTTSMTTASMRAADPARAPATRASSASSSQLLAPASAPAPPNA